MLVERLSQFLDEKLGFEKIDEVTEAINLVLKKRQEIYEKARQSPYPPV